MVSEWPRSGNSMKSVMAGDLWYSLRVEVVMAAGTVWSWPPAVSSSGPRVLFPVFTFAGDRGVKFARAASNSGLPGEGTVQRSYRSADSCSGSRFPKPYRNCSGVSDIARLRLAGLRSAIEATFSADTGQVE